MIIKDKSSHRAYFRFVRYSIRDAVHNEHDSAGTYHTGLYSKQDKCWLCRGGLLIPLQVPFRKKYWYFIQDCWDFKEQRTRFPGQNRNYRKKVNKKYIPIYILQKNCKSLNKFRATEELKAEASMYVTEHTILAIIFKILQQRWGSPEKQSKWKIKMLGIANGSPFNDPEFAKACNPGYT